MHACPARQRLLSDSCSSARRVRYPASFSAPLAVGALRLASVPTTKFREDFHLLTTVHAGHTRKTALPPARGDRAVNRCTTRTSSGGGGTRTPKGLRPPHFEGSGFCNVSRRNGILIFGELDSLARRATTCWSPVDECGGTRAGKMRGAIFPLPGHSPPDCLTIAGPRRLIGHGCAQRGSGSSLRSLRLYVRLPVPFRTPNSPRSWGRTGSSRRSPGRAGPVRRALPRRARWPGRSRGCTG